MSRTSNRSSSGSCSPLIRDMRSLLISEHYSIKRQIAESLTDPRIRRGVQTALYTKQDGYYLEKYGFNPVDHSAYIQKNMKRFENPRIHDEIIRVARSPIRKLSPSDRLVKPAKELMERGIEADGLARGIAAALTYFDPNDSESSELNAYITKHGIEDALNAYLQLSQRIHLDLESSNIMKRCNTKSIRLLKNKCSQHLSRDVKGVFVYRIKCDVSSSK